MHHQYSLQIKRIYESPLQSDGMRILVDRLWPRGVRRTDADVQVWLKEVAPSPALRMWFGHDRARFDEFKQAYELELDTGTAHAFAVQQIVEWLNTQPVTLLYAAKDQVCNHAVVLRDYILAIPSL